MGLLALDVHDEADTAGVVLIARVIKTLLGRQAGMRMGRGMIRTGGGKTRFRHNDISSFKL
jgi:hypothetical protein